MNHFNPCVLILIVISVNCVNAKIRDQSGLRHNGYHGYGLDGESVPISDTKSSKDGSNDVPKSGQATFKDDGQIGDEKVTSPEEKDRQLTEDQVSWNGDNYFQKWNPKMMKSHGYMDKDGWLSKTVSKVKMTWTPVEHIQKVIYIRQPIEVIKMPVVVEEKSFTIKNKSPLVTKSKVFGGHIVPTGGIGRNPGYREEEKEEEDKKGRQEEEEQPRKEEQKRPEEEEKRPEEEEQKRPEEEEQKRPEEEEQPRKEEQKRPEEEGKRPEEEEEKGSVFGGYRIGDDREGRREEDLNNSPKSVAKSPGNLG